MKIFLSGISYFKKDIINKALSLDGLYILESYAYIDKWLIPYINREYFLLDSGAFTFRQKNQNNTNWNEYLKEYANFIMEHDIKYFFELDIDNIIGYDKVLSLRDRLEELTSRPCIPVWHPNRGKEDYIEMCKKYKYVAIGGIAGNANKHRYIRYFPWFIKIAHEQKCKLHCLGFTDTSKLLNYKFDSVDSVSWLSGGRYGTLYKFDINKRKMEVQNTDTLKTKKEMYRKVNLYNFKEWCKYQKYAEEYL